MANQPTSILAWKYGDRFLYRYLEQEIEITVLLGAEPVDDLFGRPMVRIFARRADTKAEGYMVFGPTYEAELL